MKKILFFSIVCFHIVCNAQTNFRSTNTSNVSQTINTNGIALQRISAINTGTVTVYVNLYDFQTITTGTIVSVPTYTTIPIWTIQVCPQAQIWWYSSLNSGGQNYKNNFLNGCYVRTVTGAVSTNTVSPISTIILDVTY